MHSSSVLAVLAVVGSAQAAYAAPAVSSEQAAATIPSYPVSSEEAAATVPAYSVSSEEAAATIPAYSVSTEEASASAPVYPYWSSENALFNLTRTAYATRFLNASASATTSCTKTTNAPSSSVVVIPSSPVVVVPSSTGVVPIQTEETDVTITVYPSVQTQQASANAPTTISLTVTSTVQLCSAKYETVTITETDTITVTPQPSAQPSAPIATEEASTEEDLYTTTTKVVDVTVTGTYAPIQTEEASASFSTLHQTSTKTSTFYVQPLSTNPALSYQNATASLTGSRPAYSGPVFEGGAARYSVAGFTMVAMMLALVL